VTKQIIRYAQCWEDAEVLLDALQIQPHHTCLAIASAGDNALAMLARSPRHVVALDYNPSQIACLELRIAAYQVLDDDALLRFSGARQTTDRQALYRLCRPEMSMAARAFWDARPDDIEGGFLAAGRFEKYLAFFQTWLLPRIHPPATIASVFLQKTRAERAYFYDSVWNTWRWRSMFGMFFSRDVMQRAGRDPRFFRHAQVDLRAHLEQRVRHAFVDLDPACNPYLHWMLTGTYGATLPFSLRCENIAAIRANLDRLSLEIRSLEDYLDREQMAIDRFALSDVFEYLDAQTYAARLQRIVARSAPGARLAYWNMLVSRTRPEHLATSIIPDRARADALHETDKTFFYSRFVIEDVCSA
jgi:S-adenosylmethionine-diacylglycerol 3-amino-3-carboxypropyl transferase